MKECDRQQRISKQNDYFTSRDSQIPQRENLSSFKMFQQIEIDDFNSFLGLITDLQIIRVTDAEIQLKNGKSQIIYWQIKIKIFEIIIFRINQYWFDKFWTI